MDAASAKVAGIILVGGCSLGLGVTFVRFRPASTHFCGYNTMSCLPVHSEVFPYFECKLNIDVVLELNLPSQKKEKELNLDHS